VTASKWQLTFAQVPRLGVLVWGNAEDMFLYRAVTMDLLILALTFIMPSRCDEVYPALPG
jgi:hypothetical protein